MDAHYYDGQDLEALATLSAYQEWILEKFRPYLRGKVIEIGAGLGNITSRYADGVEELLLVEPAKNLEGILRERFESRPHVRVLCALVEKVVPAAHGVPFGSALMVIYVTPPLGKNLLCIARVRDGNGSAR